MLAPGRPTDAFENFWRLAERLASTPGYIRPPVCALRFSCACRSVALAATRVGLSAMPSRISRSSGSERYRDHHCSGRVSPGTKRWAAPAVPGDETVSGSSGVSVYREVFGASGRWKSGPTMQPLTPIATSAMIALRAEDTCNAPLRKPWSALVPGAANRKSAPDRLSSRGAKHPKPSGDAIERLQDPPLTPGQDLAPIGRFGHPFARPISQVNVTSSLRPMVGPAGFEPATKGL